MDFAFASKIQVQHERQHQQQAGENGSEQPFHGCCLPAGSGWTAATGSTRQTQYFVMK